MQLRDTALPPREEEGRCFLPHPVSPPLFPFLFFSRGTINFSQKKKKEIPRFYPPRLSTRAAAYFLFDSEKKVKKKKRERG